MIQKMADLKEEREALVAEEAELEGPAMPNVRELALFFLEELRAANAPAAAADPFVSRMQVDRDGSVHVEFSIDGRAPVHKGAGVLIGTEWLAKSNHMRTVRLAHGAYAWALGTYVIVTRVCVLARPKRGGRKPRAR
jgi:hypothetical protein